MRADYHTHSTFSDGKNAPEEMVRAAEALCMAAIGFSDHSYTAFDTACCMAEGAEPAYQAEIRRLGRAYEGRIRVLCGVEQDYFSGKAGPGYDYVIGSVHNVLIGGEYLAVDWLPEHLLRAAELLGGDMLAVTERYYDLVSRVAEVTGCQVIGHFDLISKLNDRFQLFDPQHPRYLAAWQRAADALLATGLPFEINTGAIARGYRQTPYPAEDILRYLIRGGARFLLSSDCHRQEDLMHGFDAWGAWARGLGATLIDTPLG